MGLLAASSSHCLPHWSLFDLSELPVFLGSEPQWAPNHSGKYQLMCWLQILPLEPALPKTMLGFSKMHSSVSGWISGISLIAVGKQVSNVILVFCWLSSSIVALALLLYDAWIQTATLLYDVYFMRFWISLSCFYWPSLSSSQKDSACYLQLITLLIPWVWAQSWVISSAIRCIDHFIIALTNISHTFAHHTAGTLLLDFRGLQTSSLPAHHLTAYQSHSQTLHCCCSTATVIRFCIFQTSRLH